MSTPKRDAPPRLVRYQETLLAGAAISLGHGLTVLLVMWIFMDQSVNILSLCLCVLASIVVFISGLINVPTGYQGIIKHFDEPQPGRLLHNGNHWIYPIPWARSVEIMHTQSKALEGEILNQLLEFRIYNFMPIKVQVRRVRWRISDPKMQLESHEPIPPAEIMEHVQDAVLILGQSESATMVDILTRIGKSFKGLEEMVNDQLLDKRLPVAIVDIGLPRVTPSDPRFDEFCLRIAEINLWRQTVKMSGESFVNSFYVKADGRIKYSSHSVDVSRIIDELRDYFKSR